MEEFKIRFVGGKKVVASLGGHEILTDQPQDQGGEGKDPAPLDLFLASIGTCAGYFVLVFCEKRGISTEGIELTQKLHWDETKHLYTKIILEIHIPESFPLKYRESLVNSAQLCSVKKHLQSTPEFEVMTRVQG